MKIDSLALQVLLDNCINKLCAFDCMVMGFLFSNNVVKDAAIDLPFLSVKWHAPGIT
jgi:hypothetical protein